MLRRDWIAALCAFGLSLLGSQPAWAATHLDANAIRVALRTATEEESGFIDGVVELARKGDLPPDLVESTFLWARKKPKHKFQYFKWALISRAAAIGIDIQ